jgi:hypothetical protein
MGQELFEEQQRLTDTSEWDDKESPSHRQSQRSKHVAIMLSILTRTLAIIGCTCLCLQLYHLISPTPPVPDIYRPSTLPKNLNHCDCGPDIATALTRNCIYDSLATAWLPPHCRDDTLTAEFDRAGPGPNGAWPYYADANGTIPLSKLQLGLLGETNGTFWSLREWHVAHCTFYWLKYVRMRETAKVMEDRFDRVMHVRHCARLILKPRPEGLVLLEVDVVMNSVKV